MADQKDDLPSLDKLGQKIEEAQNLAGVKREGDDTDAPQGAGAALQVGIELVSGVAVGSFLGFGLDKWLGTMPLFFIICFFLGAAAGFKNLIARARMDSDKN